MVTWGVVWDNHGGSVESHIDEMLQEFNKMKDFQLLSSKPVSLSRAKEAERWELVYDDGYGQLVKQAYVSTPNHLFVLGSRVIHDRVTVDSDAFDRILNSLELTE